MFLFVLINIVVKCSGKVKINIQQEHKDGAIFACNSVPGSQTSPAVAIERRLDERYLALQDDGSSYRVQGKSVYCACVRSCCACARVWRKECEKCMRDARGRVPGRVCPST
jgi:hypothetical protein